MGDHFSEVPWDLLKAWVLLRAWVTFLVEVLSLVLLLEGLEEVLVRELLMEMALGVQIDQASEQLVAMELNMWDQEP